MILQQLARDADRLVNLPPSMYKFKPIRWLVRLSSTGQCLGIQPLSGGGKKDKGKSLLVPHRGRAGQKPLPYLLADKVSFTWGISAEDPQKARHDRERYLRLLERCAAETGNADVAVITAFLTGWTVETLPLPEEMLAEDLTIFEVNGRNPVAAPEVRAFWAREASRGGAGGGLGQCLICGLHTQLVDRLPLMVQGIPQGQSAGVALVSANEKAYESYGLKNAFTSPTCQSCGERFAYAANALLESPQHCVRLGPVAYLFWAPEAEFDVAFYLNQPDPQQVREMLRSAHAGRLSAPGDDTPFYATALSAAISRAVVRFWLHSTVGEVRRRLVEWFELQELVDPSGQPGEPLSLTRLAGSLYREFKDIPARVPETLLRTALQGAPLPPWLLHQAVRRNQAERRVTYPRAALIKAVLCSPASGSETERKENLKTMAGLNPEHPDPAYHCGRLLAVLEDIQRLAVPGIKATLVDRYYAGASTAPARVFGVLVSGAQAHLSKLRKTHGPAYAGRSRAMEEVLAGLNGFPATLTLRQQALFSLGYYHQKAADRAARRNAGAIDAGQDTSTEQETDSDE